MKKYLPIGTILRLKGGSKRVMIFGRKQMQDGTLIVWDYIACLYPEGNISHDQCFLFNHEQIEKIYFIGYQDEEELEYHDQYLSGEKA